VSTKPLYSILIQNEQTTKQIRTNPPTNPPANSTNRFSSTCVAWARSLLVRAALLGCSGELLGVRSGMVGWKTTEESECGEERRPNGRGPGHLCLPQGCLHTPLRQLPLGTPSLAPVERTIKKRTPYLIHRYAVAPRRADLGAFAPVDQSGQQRQCGALF